jgi:type IV pilus assembly protein PilB
VIEKRLEVFLRLRLDNFEAIPDEDRKTLMDEKKKNKKRFVEILPLLSADSQKEVSKLMSEYHEIDFLDLDQAQEVNPEATKMIPEEISRRFKCLPVKCSSESLTVAMVDPTDVVLIDRLGQYARREIQPVFAAPKALDRTIERAYGSSDTLGKAIQVAGGSSKRQKKQTAAMPAGDGTNSLAAQTINIVNLIIEKAIESRASDIHLEPGEKSFYVRYRVDGVLYDYEPAPPKSLEAYIISRFKIMANLDIAEKRLPQDGRIPYVNEDREVTLRISTFPTIYGENVVIRILDRTASVVSLKEIGLQKALQDEFETLLSRGHGIILVTGPTGSGKTTTLYAGLQTINSTEKNIITLEDPVEYRLERVRQSQIDPKSGLTFARGLRSIMRQDPDIIMVGEIRDLETAQIAIQAALTGHLVLSTLHTNDSASAVTRLMDMGVEPFLISSSLLGVVAQRLVRALCPRCKKLSDADPALVKQHKFDELFSQADILDDKGKKITPKGNLKFYERGSCDQCKETGFHGRLGTFEVLVPDEDIRKLIVRKESAEVIKRAAIEKGMLTLKQDGLMKVVRGLTTLDEILRVTQSF